MPATSFPPPAARTRAAWASWFAGCLLVVLAGCSRTPPEQALREAVHGLQSAVESRDAAAVAGFLADDFIGPDGLDREGMRRLAALYLLRSRQVSAVPGPLDIQLQDDHARVRFTAVVTAGAGRLLPDSARVHAVDSGWRLEDGDWKMTSARWSARD